MSVTGYGYKDCYLNSPGEIEHNPKKGINVLSLDGGGCLGILSAEMLKEIEARVGHKTREIFAVISGTSVGSLIGAGLSLPDENDIAKPKYTASYLCEFMKKKMPQVFAHHFIRTVETLDGLLGSKYTPDGMRKAATEIFQETKIKDLLGHFLFPAFNQTTGEMLYFTDTKAQKNPTWADVQAADMLEATTAAPTYFPPKQVAFGDHTYTLLDGGVGENNPSVNAAEEAIKLYDCGNKMVLTSIGTGSVAWHVSKKLTTGLLGAGLEVISEMFAGQASAARKTANHLVEQGGFFELQFQLAADKDVIDDASTAQINYLVDLAQQTIEQDDEKLADLCKKLEKNMC
jgi:uncharacterized protein